MKQKNHEKVARVKASIVPLALAGLLVVLAGFATWNAGIDDVTNALEAPIDGTVVTSSERISINGNEQLGEQADGGNGTAANPYIIENMRQEA